MKKIDVLKNEFLLARKNNNVLKKQLLSTVLGEYNNLSKRDSFDGNSDLLIENISKKMIKSLNEIGGEDASKEISIMETFLPNMASKSEIKDFLSDKDLTLGGRLIGLAKQHFDGKVDAKLVKTIIDEMT